MKILILLKDSVLLFVTSLGSILFLQELFNGNMAKQNFPIIGIIVIGIIFLAFVIGCVWSVYDDIKAIINKEE